MKNSFKTTIAILLLFIMVVFGLYYFVYEDIRKRNENINTLENQLSLQNEKRSYLISTQNTIKNKSHDIDRINKSIISLSGEIGFIESLETMARNKNLEMNIISIDSENNNKLQAASTTVLKIKASLSGSWDSTYKFLYELESLPTKVKVTDFSTNASLDSAGKSSAVWESQFYISVLEYK